MSMNQQELIALYLNGNNVTYFDSFGIKHIPKENKKIIDNKNIITNINGIKKNNSIIVWILLYYIY